MGLFCKDRAGLPETADLGGEKEKGFKKRKKRKRNRKREIIRYQQETGRECDVYTKGDIRGSRHKGGAVLAADSGGVPMKRRHSPGCMPYSCLLSPSVACYSSVRLKIDNIKINVNVLLM